jgi:hypothetical protein
MTNQRLGPVTVGPRRYWLLTMVPVVLRQLPLLRRYYWQDWQIEAGRERAEQLAKDLDWGHPGGCLVCGSNLIESCTLPECPNPLP